MVSLHSLWKGYFDPGESGKRKNMACNGNRRILYEWKRTSNALPIEPFNVLYQTAEDGIADTIKPRLAKCGADMTRVRFINEDEKQLSMTDDRLKKPSARTMYAS